MIKATFYKSGKDYCGFELSGHSGFAREGRDIVCAAVSSAVYLAVNTLTDAFKIDADITVSEGYMKAALQPCSESNLLFEGLYNHLLQLSEQYTKEITVKTTEV